ncbi:DNA methyltransferase [Turicibacter sp. TJ11]|mgnify:CR=1 FL=1|uniref:DNA methyltransferase n=1 Tax=Turicibacter sp. TJ11 TaxID=2806443 RepID=UPI001F32B08B|nr:DNA methyltransferase [Turicibacter sp. TJ11]
MGFNYGYEKKKFDSRWKRLEVEYCDAGMSEEQIAAMKEYDWAWFCSQRVFQNHTQPIPCEQYDEVCGQSQLFRKFASLSYQWDVDKIDQTRYGWLASVENEQESLPKQKEFLYEMTNENKAIKSSWGVFDAQSTTVFLKKLIPQVHFDNPKPINLMKYLMSVAVGPEDYVMDFFSGSGTTAHALLQQNAEDGGHRKFILVQIQEPLGEETDAYAAGFKNICDVGEERLRRVGKIIREESPLTTGNLDIGFRVFKVDSSNMEDVFYRPADYNQGQMELFADNIKPNRTPEDLLFQVMLDLGILLSSDIQETEIAGKKVFSVADGYLIACFDLEITEETVTEIAKKKPFYAVFRDSGIASDSVMTNFEQIFETYSPKTQRKVL